MVRLDRLPYPSFPARLLLALSLLREVTSWVLAEPRCVLERTLARQDHSCCTSTIYGFNQERLRRAWQRHLSPTNTRPRQSWVVSLTAVLDENTDSEIGIEDTTEESDPALDNREAPVFLIKGLRQGTTTWPESEDTNLEGDRDLQAEGKYKDERSAWEKIEQSLGLGTWSYVTLGVSIFIILLNTTLGPGWLARLVQGDDYNPGIVTTTEGQQAYQVMPLDDPVNLLE